MGRPIEKLDKCPLTNEPISNFSVNHDDTISYLLPLDDFDSVTIYLCKNCYQKRMQGTIRVAPWRHAIRGLLLNKKLPQIYDQFCIHWDPNDCVNEGLDLKKEVEQAIYPKTAKDKQDNLFEVLYRLQTYDGSPIDITPLKKDNSWKKWYFKTCEEFEFYVNSLASSGMLTGHAKLNEPPVFNFTFKGINSYISQIEKGFNSNECFVAMSFQSGMEKIRDTIKTAIVATGFTPIIVDEKHVNSDKTINDEIIACIKKSKFCVADFSHHRNGVYFESGFALGLGKPVIYMCSKAEFNNAHFDIKPLQHIIYDDESDLEKKLVDKINAWIK